MTTKISVENYDMKTSVDALYMILADNITTITDPGICPVDLRQIERCNK